MKKLIAVASGGGHWKQLMLLRPAFQKLETTYVTTIDGLPQANNCSAFKIITDTNKDELIKSIVCLFQMFKIFIIIRPDVVISTGALPGLIGIFVGRLFGAKTIWVDSIANSKELSMAGRMSRRIAHHVLSQWPELAGGKVQYKGSLF